MAAGEDGGDDAGPGRNLAAFEVLVREHYNVIENTCYRRLNDRAAAEDAAAETFRIAWQHVRKGGGVTLPWLYVTARNVVGTEYRRRKRHDELIERAGTSAAPIDFEFDDEALDVHRALAQLSEQHREVLIMTYWEQLRADEIAAILGIRRSAVWMRISRAKNHLERLLTGSSQVEVTPARDLSPNNHETKKGGADG